MRCNDCKHGSFSPIDYCGVLLNNGKSYDHYYHLPKKLRNPNGECADFTPKHSLRRLLSALWHMIIDHAGTCKDEYGTRKVNDDQ